IHIFGTVGLLLCFAGTLSAGITLYDKFASDVYVHRNPLILLAIFLFLVGIQFVMVGLLAELIIRTYHESQGKKTYTIAKTVNLPSKSDL
ncbi:MAG: glycosyl transferase family protein, partial [bacterium]